MDIIILIFVSRRIWALAIQKGERPNRWVLYNIFAWVLTEVIGCVLAMMLFGSTNMVAVKSIGLFSAFGGYLFVRSILEKKPDSVDDDINKIGSDDLQPPKNR